MTQHEIFYLIGSYLLGSIPFGFLIYYFTEKKDIRKEGSGNIGATNVLRTKGKFFGILTLILDILKGVLPIVYGFKHFDNKILIIFAGGLAIIGHVFPFMLKFKGGKGVATFVGVFVAYKPISILVFLTVFLITVIISKYVSLGSILATTSVFFTLLFTSVAEISAITLVIVIIVLFRHKSNITRLINGNENKLKF